MDHVKYRLPTNLNFFFLICALKRYIRGHNSITPYYIWETYKKQWQTATATTFLHSVVRRFDLYTRHCRTTDHLWPDVLRISINSNVRKTLSVKNLTLPSSLGFYVLFIWWWCEHFEDFPHFYSIGYVFITMLELQHNKLANGEWVYSANHCLQHIQ